MSAIISEIMKHSESNMIDFFLMPLQRKTGGGGSSPVLFYDPLFLSTKPYRPFCMEMKTTSGTLKLLLKLDKYVADSLPQASFGGVAVEGKAGRLDVVMFYKQVFSLLQNRGVKLLKVSSQPSCYDPTLFSAQHDVLTCEAATRTCTETNAWLPACKEDVYKQFLHRSEKNKLNKARKAGLTCEQLPGYVLPLAYKIIQQNRHASGYPVTMQEDDLAELFRLMPDKYRLFGVWMENTLVAAAVCVEVTPEVLYTFYLADDHDYRQYSPTVLLVAAVCDYAYRLGYRLVDLGTVSDKGQLNKGLYDFKAHLGASFCSKCTYEVEL